MPYSAKSTGVPLNEFVSTTSQPTSRKALWTFSTASGRVTSRFSLQPSKRGPPKSSRVRFWTCRLVPMAPSKTTMRSLIASSRLGIWVLPICDCQLLIADSSEPSPRPTTIGNRHRKSAMIKAPRLTTRSLEIGSELFSGLFYVAASRFNSPRQLSNRIEAYLDLCVNLANLRQDLVDTGPFSE